MARSPERLTLAPAPQPLSAGSGLLRSRHAVGLLCLEACGGEQGGKGGL